MFKENSINRIIQESVPGKQVSIAHIIASPNMDVYGKIGIDSGQSIGILTLTPSETSIIAADIATKAASVSIGFLDRFTGSLVLLGDVDSVDRALSEVCRVLEDMLGFTTVDITRT